MSYPLSIIIVKNPVLDPLHVDFVIDALNHQLDRRFNTFWLDQTPDPADLLRQLQAARFDWQAYHMPGPTVGGIACWELVQPFAFLVEQPTIGTHFTYLHMECLPEADFVEKILSTLAEVERHLGPRNIYMLQQLWCPFTVHELHPRRYLDQLRSSDLRNWTKNGQLYFDVYRRYSFAWFEQPWEEDAFLMPTALAREYKFFSAVDRPLFFQDIFDIFPQFEIKPYTQNLRWVRIPTAVCYHIQHARAFHEYSRPFLDAVRAHPELFAGSGLFDVALTDQSYTETTLRHQVSDIPAHLDGLYVQIRQGPRGSVTLWSQALDRANGG